MEINSNKPEQKLSLPWKTRFSLSLIAFVFDIVHRADGAINRRLATFLDLRSPSSRGKPIKGVISSDITVDTSRNLWFRLYAPVAKKTDHPPTATSGDHGGVASESDPPLPVLIYFHGGGFVLLSAESRLYDVFCRRLAKSVHAIVVSVEYRLCPEHRFPSQYDDGFDVVKFLDENHRSILPPTADLSRCFLIGDSAGANLAHHVAVRICRSPLAAARIVGLISIQPFFGGNETTESEMALTADPLLSIGRTNWMWKAFLPEGSDRDHYAVNVSGPNAEDISELDFPDSLIFIAAFDPLKDWQRRYYEWLTRSGKKTTLIEYPNMMHAFYLFSELQEASLILSQVKEFVAHRLAAL